MRKRIQILIGLLWIFAALFFIGKSVPVAREYISFDRQQDEMLHTFIQNEEVMQRQNNELETTIPDLRIDFTSLQRLNPDIIGWLYIAALEINYPILLGKDNEEYLHKNYLHEDQYLGSIFVHYQCSMSLIPFYSDII